MAPTARRPVTGDDICIGLNYKASAFVHRETAHTRELVKHIVDEVRSPLELRTLPFTSIQLNHNTISAPHT